VTVRGVGIVRQLAVFLLERRTSVVRDVVEGEASEEGGTGGGSDEGEKEFVGDGRGRAESEG